MTNASNIATCPVALDDRLIFAQHKRVVMHRETAADGRGLLHLHLREQVISIDDPALFGFGEQLAKSGQFLAGSACQWGSGSDWPRVQGLLEQLLEAGILQREAVAVHEPAPSTGLVASPLTAAADTQPRTWRECEQLTRAFTGRSIELGYLEVVLPLYRIAHPALDAEGRQVGEANVFPPALRLDVPTEWRACHYAGSRWNDAFPMNVSALKAMIKHWKPMLAVLARVRADYAAMSGMQQPTIGDVQRMSSLAMGVSAFLLMREREPRANGTLHPVWSSLFRICDGLRMAMHEMLFTPTDGAPHPPTTPVRGADIYPYVERKQLLLSEHGVCAGPRALIEEFAAVFVDGRAASHDFESDGVLRADLDCLEPALQYGLRALQVYATVFSLWPLVSQTHERLLGLLAGAQQPLPGRLPQLQARLQQDWPAMASGFLGDAAAREARMRAHADMYAGGARALGDQDCDLGLRLEAAESAELPALVERVARCLGAGASELVRALSRTIAQHLSREQALVRVASELQATVNELLGRASPRQPLTAADLALHHRLRIVLQFPYLDDALAQTLGIALSVQGSAIDVTESFANTGLVEDVPTAQL